MNPVWGHIAGVVTVLLMLTFVGIWIWAWNGRHKRVFKRMSEIPLDELDDATDEHGTRIKDASDAEVDPPADPTGGRRASMKKEQS